jgi:hypothetical protein
MITPPAIDGSSSEEVPCFRRKKYSLIIGKHGVRIAHNLTLATLQTAPALP